MTERGIPKAFRNEEVTVFDVIKQNLKNAVSGPESVKPFAQPIPRAITDFGTGQIQVTSTPVQVVGVFRRRGVMITNLSNNQVFIGNNAAVTTSSGQLLQGSIGAWVAFSTDSAIFAVCASGQTATVCYSEVY